MGVIKEQGLKKQLEEKLGKQRDEKISAASVYCLSPSIPW
jgi:hypothetical protein